MENAKICPRCGKENKAEWAKCYQCAWDFNIAPPPVTNVQNTPVNNQGNSNVPNNPNTITCPACGRILGKSAKKCPDCGSSLPTFQSEKEKPSILKRIFMGILAAILLWSTIRGCWSATIDAANYDRKSEIYVNYNELLDAE